MSDVKQVVNRILEGADVRKVLSEESNKNPWNMSLPGKPDFMQRVIDDVLSDEESIPLEYIKGPVRAGQRYPEYIDVRVDRGGGDDIVTYRYYSDGGVYTM